jgi:2,3-bisphosphoglycerate-dependent phosphoglycerate mutase
MITMISMNRIALVLAIVLAISVQSFAQNQITTFILVRHAERGEDGTKDPDISEDGKKRANRLAEMLSKTSIAAIYSTAYKRTRNTVGPLAGVKGLEVLQYEALKGEAIDKMLQDHAGQTVVVCGHSNTIPWTANYLTGNNEFKDFADNDYTNFLVVSVLKKGTTTKVTWLSY